MTVGVVRAKDGESEAFWLKGMPDCAIIMGRHNPVVIVVVENKSSPCQKRPVPSPCQKRPVHPGLGQLLFYVFLAQLGHILEPVNTPVVGILMAPDVFYKVIATVRGPQSK